MKHFAKLTWKELLLGVGLEISKKGFLGRCPSSSRKYRLQMPANEEIYYVKYSSSMNIILN